MESWSYASEGKSFAASDEAVSDNSFSRSRNMLMAWEPKYPSCSYGNNNMLLVSSTQSVTENKQGIGELEFPEMVIKELLDDDSIGDVFSTRSGGGSMSTLNAFAKKGESSSKALLSSVVESNSSRDSLLIDLKLGRFADHRDAQSLKGSNLSSAESSTTPAKRSRSTGFNTQIAFCQVHGCNKDLSGSKGYHKRHKVCDIHSKTAKVIVNGIEQRFCQQCSRFHLLGEFDDDKRSCRKRLAGHNERRRKPQVGVHPGTTARFLQSYNGLAGTRLYGTTLTAMSFICPEILPSGLMHPEKYETNDWCRRIKVEDGTDFNPPSAIPIINGHPHSKSVFSSYSLEKQYPHFHDNGASTASGSVMSENNNLYHPHDSSGPNYGARSLFQDSSLGSKDLTVFDTASTVQGLSAISSTGCALSLLSSQTHNSSNHSSGIPMAQPLNIPGSHAHYSMSQVSERLLGVSSQPLMSGLSNKFHSSGMNSADGNDLNPILVSDGNSGVNFEDTYGVFQGSDFANAKGHLSCENGATINLLQLSSQLQRVKRQRQSMPVKLENDAFCCLRIT